ncbi:MAG: serine hydrolase [Acidobacteriota bacterium]
MNVERAGRVLASAVAGRVFPAAAIEAGGAGGPVWSHAVGRLTYADDAPPATAETVFDLASLTKVIATATVAMNLVDLSRLDLDDPIRRWLPEWSGAGRDGATVRDLFEHCSGLPAWRALYQTCEGRSEFVAEICRLELAYPRRAESVYSDLGFILLGVALERAGGGSLDELFAAAIRPSLGEAAALPLLYRPTRRVRHRCAPTGLDQWRGRLLQGEVHDQNAWALGGVAGHAGLFGTAAAVGAFARAVLRTLAANAPDALQLASPSIVRRFVTPSDVAGSSRALAWDTMRPTSSCGTRMSSEAIGHTGFTGTSLWIDPASDSYVVLLTNRVHPAPAADRPIQDVRRAVHDALMEPTPA